MTKDKVTKLWHLVYKKGSSVVLMLWIRGQWLGEEGGGYVEAKMYKNFVFKTRHKRCKLQRNPGVKQTKASVQFHSTNKHFTLFYFIRQTVRLLILSKGRRQTDGHVLHTKITFSLTLRQRLIIYIVNSPNNPNSNRTPVRYGSKQVSVSCHTERHNHVPVLKQCKKYTTYDFKLL